jgi:hypothetical protein
VSRSLEQRIEDLEAEVASLKVNIHDPGQLGGRVRQLEKENETFLKTHWWMRLLFWIDGWPSTKIASRRHWRPWHWLLSKS